jgi:hypothetical protein
MSENLSLTAPGHFVVGCNYWASHAGTNTWSDWRGDVVRRDLQALASAGLQVLRVFPLWPDFQPIHFAYRNGSRVFETHHGDRPVADDEAGRAGVSLEAMQHFAELVAIAEECGLRLVVGLVTGWMSGRLFMPPALEGRNPITDPLAILWQVRFVQYFVRRFLDCPAILAWDLGNECNVMGKATREEAWLWTSSIVSAIRAVDKDRPIVSGMHSLSPQPNEPWSIFDQGELTDALTTHPYPIFTPHADCDPINTIRSCLHATAETRLYADLSGKPALAEEIGTLGPMIASDAIAADYIRTVLWSLWAHDCHGLFWWCGFDQAHLGHAPYDWDVWERELGLLRIDHSAKPVLHELTRFRRFLDSFPHTPLPSRTTQAVCILSAGQDAWAAGYASFILAKQAGFDIRFQHSSQALAPAPLYLLPSIRGGSWMPRRRWLELLERVRAGATLYMSCDEGMIGGFEEVTGLEVQTRQRRSGPAKMTLSGLPGAPVLACSPSFRLNVKPTRAEALGVDDEGNPCFSCASLGRGKVYFLACGLETDLAKRSGAFVDASQPWWQVYRHVAKDVLGCRAVGKTSPRTGLTEHPLDGNRRIIVAINYSPEPVEECFALAPEWRVGEFLVGRAAAEDASGLRSRIEANDAVVFVATASR